MSRFNVAIKLMLDRGGFKVMGLTKKEERIYKMRLKGMTHQAIADNFGGVCRERIRQIEGRILRKLERQNNPGLYENLSIRAENALRSAGIKSVAEARLLGDYKLLTIKNLGKKTLFEIRGWNVSK